MADSSPLSRYFAQELFPAMGCEGQARLARARVGLVGCGALGSTLANLLVRAGVGCLRVIDRDYVEVCNLHRQSLFTEEDASRRLPKAVAAVCHLRSFNSEVFLEPVVGDFNSWSAPGFAEDLDLLVDGSDNFATRYLLNDVAVSRGLPWVHAGVIGAAGLVLSVLPGEGPCLRCVFPDPPGLAAPTCDTVGVLNCAPAVAAGIQAAEVMKLLVAPETRCRGILSFDLWDGAFQVGAVQRDPRCPACGQRFFPYLQADAGALATVVCGQSGVQVVPPPGMRVDLAELASRLHKMGETHRNAFLVEAEVEGKVLVVFGDGRALVKGTRDTGQAQSLYSRYVGH